MVRPIRSTAILVAVLMTLAPSRASAEDPYVRVISQRAPVHTGPGSSYREIYVAERGQVFEVLERGTKAFWFRVRLDDGTSGWIFGELVFPFEVVEEEKPGALVRAWRASRRAIFGPSPVPYANVEIAVSGGILGSEGVFLFRPAYLLDPRFAVEGFFGLSPRAQEDLFTGGLGWTLRLWPGAAFGPFVHAGTGLSYLRPKADNFTDEAKTLMTLVAGGGFELTFKKQITVRFDYRNWTLFDPDEASNKQEFSGGLAIYF